MVFRPAYNGSQENHDLPDVLGGDGWTTEVRTIDFSGTLLNARVKDFIVSKIENLKCQLQESDLEDIAEQLHVYHAL